jgi:hypothetical protein
MEAAARTERMKEGTPRVDWAELLSRTFDFDVFVCMRCGGRRHEIRGLTDGHGHVGRAEQALLVRSR